MPLTNLRSSITSVDAVEWARSVLDACKGPSPDEKESLENRECFDRLNAQRLQKGNDDSDRRLMGRWNSVPGGGDEWAEESSRESLWTDATAGEASARTPRPASGDADVSLVQVTEHSDARGDPDEGDVEGDFLDDSISFSELHPPAMERNRTTRRASASLTQVAEHRDSRGDRDEGCHDECANSINISDNDTGSESGTSDGGSPEREGKRQNNNSTDIDIDDIIALKLLLANQQAAIDALELTNRQLVAAVDRLVTENQQFEARERDSRERERRLREDLARATAGLRERGGDDAQAREHAARQARHGRIRAAVARATADRREGGGGGGLARENAELRARLARSTPVRGAEADLTFQRMSRSSTEPSRVAEVDLDRRGVEANVACRRLSCSSTLPSRVAGADTTRRGMRRGSAEPPRVAEVNFDCRMQRRSSSLVRGHHSSFTSCATSESIATAEYEENHDVDDVLELLDGVGVGTTAKPDSLNGSWFQKSL